MPENAAVRRRPVFAISGWLMLVLVFVPTLRVCGDPTAPIEFPPAYFVHVGSLVAGLVAFATTYRMRKGAFIGLAAIWMLALGLIIVGFAGELSAASAALAGLGALFGIIVAIERMVRAKDLGERPYLYGLLAHALVCFGWYSLLAFDRDAMIGAYLGFVVAAVMLLAAAAAVFQHEMAAAERRRANRPPQLPTARIFQA